MKQSPLRSSLITPPVLLYEWFTSGLHHGLCFMVLFFISWFHICSFTFKNISTILVVITSFFPNTSAEVSPLFKNDILIIENATGWLPELGDSSQISSGPSDRKTRAGIAIDPDRCCHLPPPCTPLSSWRTAGTGWRKGDNFTAGTLLKYVKLWLGVSSVFIMKATWVCYSYFGEPWLIGRSSFHPGYGHSGVHTAGFVCIADCARRTAMHVIPTALSLRGQQ